MAEQSRPFRLLSSDFISGVPKPLPTPDLRLHLACDGDEVEITFPAKREAPPGEGILDKGGTGAAAADKDHLRYDLLRIFLRDAQIIGEVLFHLPRSAGILVEERISVPQKFLLRQNPITS